MKKYKVVCLQKIATVEPPEPSEIEEAIENMTSEGWHFVQMSTGGAGVGGMVRTWVYLVFAR